MLGFLFLLLCPFVSKSFLQQLWETWSDPISYTWSYPFIHDKTKIQLLQEGFRTSPSPEPSWHLVPLLSCLLSPLLFPLLSFLLQHLKGPLLQKKFTPSLKSNLLYSRIGNKNIWLWGLFWYSKFYCRANFRAVHVKSETELQKAGIHIWFSMKVSLSVWYKSLKISDKNYKKDVVYKGEGETSFGEVVVMVMCQCRIIGQSTERVTIFVD